jgi:hypothetical protein
MVARGLRLTVIASLCALACVLVISRGSAVAATQFGSYGQEAEQLSGPRGIAVNATGDVYIGDQGNSRVDKFDGSGNFLLAWGSGVVNGGGETQTCTTATLCRDGSQGGSQEAFELPTGVAVDDELSSLSYGDVYVLDEAHLRVQKYDPSGKFVLMFGGHVNETTGADVCRAGEKCNRYGTIGAANGEFSYWPGQGSNSFIAVGPGGSVYVGDTERVEVFEPSGAWKENVSLAGLSATGRPTALAVDAAGDIFLKDDGVAGVHELEANGTEKGTTFDAASTTVTSLAVDPSGDLYVGDSAGGFHVLKFDPSGKELASFGANTVASAVSGANGGLAYSNATGQLYASEYSEEGPYVTTHAASVWVLTPPPAGPLIDSESATPEVRGAGILGAVVNPEGNETTYDFEYVDEAQFNATGYASATSTAPVSLPAGFNDQPVSVNFAKGTLVPGVTYHYRLVARDSLARTSTGPDQSFLETPPALIAGPWTTDVAGSSVTFGTQIDPLGANTSYSVEYGTSTAYGHDVSGNVGESNNYVPVSQHVQGLEPDTTYHYRIVTSNEVGTWQSPDRTFTTQAATGELALLDGRAWELVSPTNKHGALILPEPLGQVQAASDGTGIAYRVSFPVTEGAPARSNFLSVQVLSKRAAGGWSSQEIGTFEDLPETENEGFQPFAESILPTFFSADLSQTMMEPGYNVRQTLSPDVTERTLYIRENATGKYVPLVTPSNVPPGTKYGGEGIGTYKGSEQQMRFLMATPDFSHVVLESPFRLTPEAAEESKNPGCVPQLTNTCPQNLYEWSAGRLALVNILPNGNALPEAEAFLGRGSKDVIHTISNDGRRVVWASGSLYHSKVNTMYVRDMVEGKTLQFGGPTARYETMSDDGSRVFYWEASELYAFDFATDTTTDLTANHAPGERRAGVKDGFIMAASEDGSYVYYVATGVLAPGAIGSQDNLYVSHYDGASWSTRLVATLSKADELVKEIDPFSALLAWQFMDAEVSSNGRYLAFMSSRSLTGYDNLDAVSERPDEEVYLYDAVANRLVCASCNPTGVRPTGVFEPGNTSGIGHVGPLVDRGENWAEHSIAANLPGWHLNEGPLQLPPESALNQPHYLSNDGRLFFNSSDALVAQDTNGLNDVYEYEPEGIGSCSNATASFSERSGGCVSLLTSGTSGVESAFMDASENGDDVFFVTSSKLVGEDVDTENDVYDAHVCSTLTPCRTEPVSPPSCTSGDSCKVAPSPQPAIFGPAPSATFEGAGNVSEAPAAAGVKRRSLTRAQKLARAVKLCQGKRVERKRLACERQARKRYHAKQARKVKASGKGGR